MGKGEGQSVCRWCAEVVTMVKGRLVKLQLWDTAGQDGPLKDGGFFVDGNGMGNGSILWGFWI